MSISNAFLNRPIKYGTQDRHTFVDRNNEAIQAQNDSNGNAIYIGFANRGTDTAVDKWQIMFITYDINNSITSVEWPQDANGNATDNYEFAWDDRLTYTFS